METQDKKFVIAYQEDISSDGIQLEIIYAKDEIEAMLYFLDDPETEESTWSTAEELQDWVWDNWTAHINYIEV